MERAEASFDLLYCVESSVHTPSSAKDVVESLDPHSGVATVEVHGYTFPPPQTFCRTALRGSAYVLETSTARPVPAGGICSYRNLLSEGLALNWAQKRGTTKSLIVAGLT